MFHHRKLYNMAMYMHKYTVGEVWKKRGATMTDITENCKATSITVSEADLKLIDKAAKIDMRNRSQFMVYHSLQEARKILHTKSPGPNPASNVSPETIEKLAKDCVEAETKRAVYG